MAVEIGVGQEMLVRIMPSVEEICSRWREILDHRVAVTDGTNFAAFCVTEEEAEEIAEDMGRKCEIYYPGEAIQAVEINPTFIPLGDPINGANAK